ncbi:MAG: NAD-dependent epimerase/dehydratase family protein, partial [Pseudomonadota bacterium]
MIQQELLYAIKGPILILGAGGFIGRNLWEALKKRDDVFALCSPRGPGRLSPDTKNVIITDALDFEKLKGIIRRIAPQTIFNLISYGNYHFQTDPELISRTNWGLPYQLLQWCQDYP